MSAFKRERGKGVHTRDSPGRGDLHELFERNCITKGGIDDSGMPELLCIPGEGTIADRLEVE